MPSTASPPSPDGRKQRSERSRAAIVAAMLALIREGRMEPSAAEVADRAGVSARTVFRHFEEMDSLYAEITERMEAEVFPLVQQPFKGADWSSQLDEMLVRRAEVYERIMPVKIAGSIRRFSSDFLMTNYRQFVALERASLERVLPPGAADDPVLVSALEMCTGFQAWRRLRQDQGLSVAETQAVVRRCVDRLLGR